MTLHDPDDGEEPDTWRIDLVYRLQADLQMLAERLARDPFVPVSEQLLYHLSCAQMRLESGLTARH